jgi:hypothetical protein
VPESRLSLLRGGAQGGNQLSERYILNDWNGFTSDMVPPSFRLFHTPNGITHLPAERTPHSADENNTKV